MIRDRICGLETEYGIAFQNRKGQVLPAYDRYQLYQQIQEQVRATYLSLEANSFNQLVPTATGNNDDIHIREGYFVQSGARLYYDAGHLEWSTPEAIGAHNTTLCDLAGERILVNAVRQLENKLDGRILLIRNNLDYTNEITYGCHENYSILRHQATENFPLYLKEVLTPFLVTRQIFTGAGRVGTLSSEEDLVGFQISQRADFIAQIESIETRKERGIINTRDEALGDKSKYRRLHLILGDTNVSPQMTFLKLGVTSLIVSMIEGLEISPDDLPSLADPVSAIRQISRDLTVSQKIQLADGREMTALVIQQWYFERAAKFLEQSNDNSMDDVLKMWGTLLEDYKRITPIRSIKDIQLISDRVDWAAKYLFLLTPAVQKAGTNWQTVKVWSHVFDKMRSQKNLSSPSQKDQALTTLLAEHQLDWNDEARQRALYYQLRELDMRYHDIDPNYSLYHMLLRHNRLQNYFSEENIITAMASPPVNTRAQIRSDIIHWLYQRTNDTNNLISTTRMDWQQLSYPPLSDVIWIEDPFQSDSVSLIQLLEDALVNSDEPYITILGEEDVRKSRRAKPPSTAKEKDNSFIKRIKNYFK